MNNDSICIRPIGGLCNKLRVIFSYLSMAYHDDKYLVVIWDSDVGCPGNFEDYFEIPLNMTIISTTNESYQKYRNDIYYEGFNSSPLFAPNYIQLKLKPYMLDLLNKKLSKLNDYVAVHVRRTDFHNISSNGTYIYDESFMRFINNYISSKHLHIATDNKETYNKFKKLYSNKIVFPFPAGDDEKALRKTTLQDSILDLYLCIKSSHFMGTTLSSYTELIITMKDILTKVNDNDWRDEQNLIINKQLSKINRDKVINRKDNYNKIITRLTQESKRFEPSSFITAKTNRFKWNI